MSRIVKVLSLSFLCGLGISCGVDSPGTSLAQPCVNGQCPGGYVCMDNFCLPSGLETGDSATTGTTFSTTGPGDGDGDPDTGPTTGDGDGDPTTGPTTGDGDGDPTTGDGDGDPTTGDGDGDPTTGGGLPNGSTCTVDGECNSGNCYIVPFLGGQCGECNEDADCVGGGCTAPNPFGNDGSVCNMGEAGGGCESSQVCQPGLSCATVLDLLGLIQISTCGECSSNADCGGQICAPIVDVQMFAGQNTCINPSSLPQDSYCDLAGNGDQACSSGICSTIDIMGLSEIGACGECNTDADCNGGTCMAGQFILDNGTLVGSTCI